MSLNIPISALLPGLATGAPSVAVTRLAVVRCAATTPLGAVANGRLKAGAVACNSAEPRFPAQHILVPPCCI